MRFALKQHTLSIAVVIAALVVTVLAALQYRWSNEAADATGLRLADTLQLSMINWHLDFLRNFSEICLTMRVDRDGRGSEEIDSHARRLGEWRALARYPDLVSRVYRAPGSALPRVPPEDLAVTSSLSFTNTFMGDA